MKRNCFCSHQPLWLSGFESAQFMIGSSSHIVTQGPRACGSRLAQSSAPLSGGSPHPVPGRCSNIWLPFLFKARQLYRDSSTPELPVWSVEASVATASPFNFSSCPILTLMVSYSCCTQVQSPMCLLSQISISDILYLRVDFLGNQTHSRVLKLCEVLEASQGLLRGRIVISSERHSFASKLYGTMLWFSYWNFLFHTTLRTSLVARWLSNHLPMQGTWVQSLVRDNPVCCGAAKPMHHNYWIYAPQRDKPPQSACAPS